MLEQYFSEERTLTRIRASWLAKPIESYVNWLAGRGVAVSTVRGRVPVLVHFGAFARQRGVRTLDDLPGAVRPFVQHWAATSGDRGGSTDGKWAGQSAQLAVQQMLALSVPGFSGARAPQLPLPFRETAPDFFDYLREERGLREPTVALYAHHLRAFERHLAAVKLHDPEALTPSILSAFVIERGRTCCKSALAPLCSNLRVFLHYLHREGVVSRDLSSSVDRPRIYRLSSIPRSITQDELRQVLEAVDRESVTGRRDLAMLLLLATYGLRASEVAALTLDSIDWAADRLLVPDRKCGHSSVYPLSSMVGEAIVAYLRHGRPDSRHRALFLSTRPPFPAVRHSVVAARAAHWLRTAGIEVRKPGSHTFRHTCVRRLLEAKVPLKVIGDYLGHSSPQATAIYSKINLEALREVALSGSGESVL